MSHRLSRTSDRWAVSHITYTVRVLSPCTELISYKELSTPTQRHTTSSLLRQTGRLVLEGYIPWFFFLQTFCFMDEQVRWIAHRACRGLVLHHGVTRPFIGAVPLSRHAQKCYWTCEWVSENVTSREAITSKNTKSRLFRKKIWYFFTHEVPITQHWDKCEKNTPFEKKIKEGVKI